MGKTEIQTALGALISDAVSYSDTVLSPARAKATDYYNGEPFGNEEEGRSQFILTEVRDAVRATLPALLKLFFGPERQVEFTPRRADQVVLAKQITEYVHGLFERDGGFIKTHACLKDGFVRKIGVFKRGWDDGDRTAYTLKNVTSEELEVLAADDKVDLISQEETGERAGDETQQIPATKLHTVSLTVRSEGKPWVDCVPPEEFLYSRSARSLDTADVLIHRTEKSLSDLVAMGYDKDEIKQYGAADTTLQTNAEELARRPEGAVVGDDPEASEANEKFSYFEVYARIDVDGDGFAELRKICAVGSGHHILHNEPVARHPFAVFIPDPEPHTLTGLCLADLTMDVQLMKTSIFRSQADGLAASIFPRIGFVEGRANINDILNTEVGAPIRMTAPGMVQPFDIPFKGADADPMIDRLDAVIERRTGQRRGVSDGLDMDALQSTSDQGVAAAVGASQAQTELYGRIFAEMTLKPLFRGLYLDIIEHQPEKHLARIAGEFVEVDPRSWDPALELDVKVALGTTLTTQRLAALQAIMAEQKEVLASLGPSNPLVTLGQYSQTFIDAAELAGFKDAAGRFFNKLPLDFQPPAAPPSKSPEQVLAEAQIQIEQMKAQKELEIKQAEFTLKKLEQDRQFEFQKEQAAADLALRQLEIQLKYQAQSIDRAFEQEQARNEQLLEGHKATVEATLQTDAHEHEKELSRAQMEHEQQLAEDQQAHDQEMAERQTAAAEQQAASSEETE